MAKVYRASEVARSSLGFAHLSSVVANETETTSTSSLDQSHPPSWYGRGVDRGLAKVFALRIISFGPTVHEPSKGIISGVTPGLLDTSQDLELCDQGQHSCGRIVFMVVGWGGGPRDHYYYYKRSDKCEPSWARERSDKTSLWRAYVNLPNNRRWRIK